MASLIARITYKNSSRQYVYWGLGETAKIHVGLEKTHAQDPQYVIQTYQGLGKPRPGISGFKLELDEESARALFNELKKSLS